MAAIRKVLATRAFVSVSISVVVVSTLPALTSAGPPGELDEFAQKLRYGPGVTNHPVGVVPSAAVRVPQGWPLDADGSITCVTCHLTLPSLAGGGGPQLRDFDGTRRALIEFCGMCHAAGGELRTRSAHWRALPSAHIRANPSGPQSAAGVPDAESKRCLGCHDGVTTAEAAHTTSGMRSGYIGDPGNAHPVGVSYPSGRGRASDRAYRSRSLLPAEILLPRGSVSCVSCHNLFAGKRHLLSVPIEGSELCLTCHDME